MTLFNGSSRRHILACVGSYFALLASPAKAQRSEAGEWLERSSLLRYRDVSGILSFTRFKDEIFILNSPISWKPNAGSSLPPVVVPRGFVTDLASVPREFFSLYRPDGPYAHAAVVHDYLYWQQTTSRVTADDVFSEAMKDLGISPVDRTILFQAVAKLGESSWNRNLALKQTGEKRILKAFPTDPRTTWSEWKVKPNVFLDG